MLKSHYQTILWFLASVCFILLLSVLYPPYWRTVDDVAMSLFSSGHVFGPEATSQLFFSNVVWGEIVHFMPSIGGIAPYSIATMVVLSITAGVLSSSIAKAQGSIVIPVLVISFIYLYPVLSPQFTINAGLLMVAAVVSYLRYQRDESMVWLIASVLLAFLSYTVRSYEAALIALLAMPFIVSRESIRDYPSLIGAFVLICLVGTAHIVNVKAYEGEEWQDFHELNGPRAAFTDFRADRDIQKDRVLMAENGYSKNDIDIFTRWFFDDPEIANPEKLNRMLDATKFKPFKDGSWFAKGRSGVETLKDRSLILLLILGLILLVLRLSPKLLVAWLVLVLVSFLVGVAGRPNVPRIYDAALVLLILYPLVQQKIFGARRLAIIASFACLLYYSAPAALTHNANENRSGLMVKRSVEKISTEVFVVWGAEFPLEYAYPVMGKLSSPANSLRIYGLGVTTLAPTMYSYTERIQGRSFLDRLKTESGIQLVISDNNFPLLKTYCLERLDAKLEVISEYDYTGRGSLRRVRCI